MNHLTPDQTTVRNVLQKRTFQLRPSVFYFLLRICILHSGLAPVHLPMVSRHCNQREVFSSYISWRLSRGASVRSEMPIQPVPSHLIAEVWYTLVVASTESDHGIPRLYGIEELAAQ